MRTFIPILSFCVLIPAALATESVPAKQAEEKPKAQVTPDAAPSGKTEEKTSPASTPSARTEKVLALPKYQVKGRKVPVETETTLEAKETVRKIDKKIERELKNTETTQVDTTLNPDKYSYLGSRSATMSAEESKQRIRELEMKQSVAAVSVDPGSDAENKELLRLLKDLDYRKNRDADEVRKE